MNRSAFTGVQAPAEWKEPLGERFRVDKFPDFWAPNGDFERAACQVLHLLVRADEARYRAYRPKNHFGSSLRNVLRWFFSDANFVADTSFGGVRFGAQPEFREKSPYATFTREYLRQRLLWCKKNGLRYRLVTGGGPGWAMEQTQRILAQLVAELDLASDMAVAVQVLANIKGEEIKDRTASEKHVVRPQPNLDMRETLLSLFGDGAFFFPFGIGGAEELSSAMLKGQLFAHDGTDIFHVTLGILLDCAFSDEERARAGGRLREGARFFDFVEAFKGAVTAMGTAAPRDFVQFVRVDVDLDPKRAALIAAEEMARWNIMRIEAGVKRREVETVQHFLEY